MNEPTQAEKRRALIDTYQGRAAVDADLPAGRFTTINKSAVTGKAPTVEYPGAAHWTADHVPPEPPLGFPIDAMEPVGEAFEVERSLARLGEAAPAGGVVASSTAVETASPSPTTRKWAMNRRRKPPLPPDDPMSDAEWMAYCERELGPRFRQRTKFLTEAGDRLSFESILSISKQNEQDMVVMLAGMTPESIDAMVARDERWLKLAALRKENAALTRKLIARATIKAVH